MLRNYYYLNRTIVELNRILHGSKVDEIYSQEKNSLLISIPTDENPYRHLFISTNPSLPYLAIKNNHRKAKKNIVQLNVLNKIDVIRMVEISKNDRLIKLKLGDFEILYSIMGGRTNIFFIRNSEVFEELRKSKGDSEIIERVANSEFTTKNIFHEIDENLFVGFDSRKIKKEYSFIPKEIISEMKYRYVKGNSYEQLFHQILKELYSGKIKVFEHKDEEKIRFAPESYRIFQSNQDIAFDDCNTAISKFLQKHYRFEKINRLKKEITKQLHKELERTANKLNNLKGRIEKGERSHEYYNYGNLLLANRHLLIKGMEIVKVVDYITNNEIIIKLNPKNVPQKSIDLYFEKAKDEKINFKISEELYLSSLGKFDKLKVIETEFENANSVDEYIEIKAKLKISDKKNEKKKVTDGVKLRELLIDGKYKVLVGRDSKSNDKLSIKIAKQNDYWFHARGLPGSHVVLRVDDAKVGVPKNIIKNAAQIAAFYSKAKTAGTAPVSYTLAKFVRKKKGMEPGKVLIEKEKVLLVRPGIPSNTEMVSEE
ncbi:MAG: NFACT RNA binding domain-containing protein [Melioribacteraceae bacterium]|jgi:predicted ribosome quality control (RQC) complex YloA/Tae2 family protein|nr:NFACT RNA binding domain-containing protein [Melioribacteraceae bacterium]